MPSKGTKGRKVRMDDLLWDAAEAAADQLGTDRSAVVRDQLADWIARTAANSEEVAQLPAVRLYLAGEAGPADECDQGPQARAVARERFGPLPMRRTA